ncbi:MAG: Uncharacterized protein G01um10142_479 [Parcubacteria group bacterium Gr01-1014_2]|nr:MAG: Uncharacterized protein G01um10142_479 [Parcubacteria group bacterium Gr01-1014_2]
MARYIGYGYKDAIKEKRKRRKVRIAFLVVSFLTGFIIFLVYALFFSGWFSIKEVQINGYKEISESDIRTLVNDYLNKKYLLNYIHPFSNILFANSGNIENFLRKSFPMIEEVNIDKQLGAKNLKIEITEREAVGIWCGEQSQTTSSSQVNQVCFYFDKAGVMFKPALKFSGEIFLTIEDSRGRNFNLSDTFDDKELFEKINLTRNILDELKFLGYSNFFLPQGSFEFWIKTKEGWHIYLDKESDVATQLVALKKFLDEKLSPERRRTLEYIDLRVNNRIYYK